MRLQVAVTPTLPTDSVAGGLKFRISLFYRLCNTESVLFVWETSRPTRKEPTLREPVQRTLNGFEFDTLLQSAKCRHFLLPLVRWEAGSRCSWLINNSYVNWMYWRVGLRNFERRGQRLALQSPTGSASLQRCWVPNRQSPGRSSKCELHSVDFVVCNSQYELHTSQLNQLNDTTEELGNLQVSNSKELTQFGARKMLLTLPSWSCLECIRGKENARCTRKFSLWSPLTVKSYHEVNSMNISKDEHTKQRVKTLVTRV